jgi:hypothetical protein
MIHNILSKSQFIYKQVFKNNIFLFSPSNNFDEVLDSLKIKDENKKDFMDEAFIENIINEQNQLIEKNNKAKAPHILMIFDDVVLQIKNTKENILKKYFSMEENIEFLVLSHHKNIKHYPQITD